MESKAKGTSSVSQSSVATSNGFVSIPVASFVQRWCGALRIVPSRVHVRSEGDATKSNRATHVPPEWFPCMQEMYLTFGGTLLDVVEATPSHSAAFLLVRDLFLPHLEQLVEAWKFFLVHGFRAVQALRHEDARVLQLWADTWQTLLQFSNLFGVRTAQCLLIEIIRTDPARASHSLVPAIDWCRDPTALHSTRSMFHLVAPFLSHNNTQSDTRGKDPFHILEVRLLSALREQLDAATCTIKVAPQILDWVVSLYVYQRPVMSGLLVPFDTLLDALVQRFPQCPEITSRVALVRAIKGCVYHPRLLALHSRSIILDAHDNETPCRLPASVNDVPRSKRARDEEVKENNEPGNSSGVGEGSVQHHGYQVPQPPQAGVDLAPTPANVWSGHQEESRVRQDVAASKTEIASASSVHHTTPMNQPTTDGSDSDSDILSIDGS